MRPARAVLGADERALDVETGHRFRDVLDLARLMKHPQEMLQALGLRGDDRREQVRAAMLPRRANSLRDALGGDRGVIEIDPRVAVVLQIEEARPEEQL